MKVITLLFCLLCSVGHTQAQRVSLNSDQRFYIETGFKSMFLQFTDMNNGGKGDPYVQSSMQVRVDVPLNVLYRNKYFQTGVVSTLFAAGTRTQTYNIDRFFAPNNINLHFAYKLTYLGKSKSNPGFSGHEGNTSIYVAEDDAYERSVEQVNTYEDIDGHLVKLTPNPTKGLIELVDNMTDLGEITILDSYGKMLFSGGHKGRSSIINLESYPSGLYFVIVHEKIFKVIKI